MIMSTDYRMKTKIQPQHPYFSVYKTLQSISYPQCFPYKTHIQYSYSIIVTTINKLMQAIYLTQVPDTLQMFK